MHTLRIKCYLFASNSTNTATLTNLYIGDVYHLKTRHCVSSTAVNTITSRKAREERLATKQRIHQMLTSNFRISVIKTV